MGSVSGLDSALVPLARELVSDFHSASDSDSASGLALESDSLAEPDSELAPEFGSASASDFHSESAESLEQLLQYPLLPVCVEFVCRAQRVPV